MGKNGRRAPRTPLEKKTKLAIFDIDGTVFRSSLIIELFNALVQRGVFPQRSYDEVQKNYERWLNRKGHYNDYLMRLVDVFYQNIAGCKVQEVASAAQAVVARQRDRVHRYPRQLITDLRRRGYFMLVISNSPEPMVRRFAQALRFDAAIGHVLEQKNGRYTGRSILEGMIRPGKAFMDKVGILTAFLREKNIHADLRNSVMIGDSEGDLPLLAHVGNPIAFNPSLPLARIAHKNGWRVIVERKDAVYDIRDAHLIPVQGQKPRVPYGHGKR